MSDVDNKQLLTNVHFEDFFSFKTKQSSQPSVRVRPKTPQEAHSLSPFLHKTRILGTLLCGRSGFEPKITLPTSISRRNPPRRKGQSSVQAVVDKDAGCNSETKNNKSCDRKTSALSSAHKTLWGVAGISSVVVTSSCVKKKRWQKRRANPNPNPEPITHGFHSHLWTFAHLLRQHILATRLIALNSYRIQSRIATAYHAFHRHVYPFFIGCNGGRICHAQ
jgi:hypothetical protein